MTQRKDFLNLSGADVRCTIACKSHAGIDRWIDLGVEFKSKPDAYEYIKKMPRSKKTEYRITIKVIKEEMFVFDSIEEQPITDKGVQRQLIKIRDHSCQERIARLSSFSSGEITELIDLSIFH